MLTEALLPIGTGKFKGHYLCPHTSVLRPPLDGAVPDASTVLYGRPGDFLVIHCDPGKAGRDWLPCFIGFYYYLGAVRPADQEPTATEKRCSQTTRERGALQRAGPRGGHRGSQQAEGGETWAEAFTAVSRERPGEAGWAGLGPAGVSNSRGVRGAGLPPVVCLSDLPWRTRAGGQWLPQE